MATKATFINTTYSAYYHRDVPKEDEELTHVGPGTPCGEWFRRYWQPVALTDALKDLPHSIKIMGEELVIFKDRSGRIGLLELHCSHRGTSLEFGLIEDKGIRCCYHGWQFDVDGRILDTPGEPPDSTYKERLCHGAYPVHEYKGLVFAYMGPPDKIPPFPDYDTYHMPGYRLQVRGKHLMPCNWLQSQDNFMDPAHLSFLHTRSSGVQFLMEDGRPSPEFGVLAELDWMETPFGMIYIATRRIDDHVWVRIADWLLPACSSVPAHPIFPPSYGHGKEELYVRPKLMGWTVPIDDINTMSLGYIHLPEDDMASPRITTTTSSSTSTYEEKQRHPGDDDALVSQRPIAIHALEHLGATDRGITMFRGLVRRGIHDVQNGNDPKGVVRQKGDVITSYGSDVFIRIPRASSSNQEFQLLRETGRRVAKHLLNNPQTMSSYF